MNLAPGTNDDRNYRRGSFNPTDLANKRPSVESLYSNISSQNFSISDISSSADSVAINKMQSINHELNDHLTSRLTTFMYFHNLVSKNSHDSSELSENKQKVSVDSSNDIQGSALRLPEFTKQLVSLHKTYQKELEKLKKNKEELETVENEENDLCERLSKIEEKVAKVILERDVKKTSCGCFIF